MATTYQLRQFSQPEVLQRMHPEHLADFLRPYAPFFLQRGITLPAPGEPGRLAYPRITELFLNPESGLPDELVEALFFVDELSNPEGMDLLLAAFPQIDFSWTVTPSDVAVQAWRIDRETVERLHAERMLGRKTRSFESFRTQTWPAPPLESPAPATLQAIEQDLDQWFTARKRGRGTRVFACPREDGLWFLVRHGEPYKREGTFEDGQSSSVFYRPEKYDVLVYDCRFGELRINARSSAEKERYRRTFGRHLFGSETFFPGTGKYTLEPLRTHGPAALYCGDILGIAWIRLQEIDLHLGGKYNEIVTHKAEDVLAAFRETGRGVPDHVRLIGARFQVRFTNAATPRMVALFPANVAQYTRDADGVYVEEWLRKRGFITTGASATHADSAGEPVLACA